MKFLTMILVLWFLSALCRSAKQVHAQKVAQREAARRSAQLAQLTADLRRQKAEAHLWAQHQIALEREQARLAREQERLAREQAQQAAKMARQEEIIMKMQQRIDNAEREIEHINVLCAPLEQKVYDLRYKTQYYDSIGLPCAGMKAQLVKLEEQLYRYETRRIKAQQARELAQHRINSIAA